ncbi:MAG: hypothetical protein HC880_00705 [Bacteroidia bacterium]|nr:hypothetical protein [Bacteroidia bacterium]
MLRTRHRGKDVTDFFRHFSREDFDRLPIESFTPRHILVTEYLTEPGPEQQLFQIFRQNPGTLLLPAPTGSGKNELVNRFISQELPKSREVRFFNGFPNNITAEAKTKEYAHPENNYSGLGLPIGLMDQYTDPIERKYLDYFQVINFVYNSYGQIEPLVSENDYMFLDEIHKWITQGSIAPVETINKILKCPARKVLMTGTPFESFVQEFNLHPLLVERSINPEVTVRCVELIRHQKSSFNAKGRQKLYRLATANLIDCLNAKEKKLHLIYLNDKQGIDYVAQRARKKGFEVELIYSDEEVKKNSQAWQCLTTSQPIPLKENQAKIVLLTSLGYDSLNLNNPEEEIGVFAVMGEKYLENLRQAIKRPRKAGKLEVLYFLAAHKHRNPFTESYDSHRQKWYSDFLKISARLSKYKPIELLRMPNSARHKLLNDVSGVITDDLEFNQLGCVIAYEQRQANQQTNAQKFDQLKKYYAVETRQLCVSKLIRLFTPAPDDPSAPPGDDDKYSSLTTQNEEDMISDSELMEEQNLHSARQVKNLLRSNVYYVLAYLYEDRRIGVRTKERIKDLLSGFYFKDLDYLYFKDSIQIDRNAYKFLMEYVFRILYLAQYFEISPEMLDMVFSGRYPAIHQQIETALVLENKDPQAHRLINQAVYRQVVDAFNVGESYSRAEQVEKITKIYEAFEHTHFSPEDHCKLFRALFVTQEDRRDKNTRRKRIKKVISLRAVMVEHGLRPKTDILAVAVL